MPSWWRCNVILMSDYAWDFAHLLLLRTCFFVLSLVNAFELETLGLCVFAVPGVRTLYSGSTGYMSSTSTRQVIQNRVHFTMEVLLCFWCTQDSSKRWPRLGRKTQFLSSRSECCASCHMSRSGRRCHYCIWTIEFRCITLAYQIIL